MFCKKCGYQMKEEEKFCPQCGSSVINDQELKDNNVVIFKLKPEFNLGYKVLSALWQVIVFLFLINLCVIRLYVLWAAFPITIVITLIAVLLYITIKMFFESKQYDNLEYNFYGKKVEYTDGFLNKEEKELKYKYIREVTMTQNIFERMFGLGTIRIFTNASSGGYGGNNHNSMKMKNGIFIHCIEDVRNQYEYIKKIIDEQTEED